MEIWQLREHWDAFGKTDPLWAILTAPGKRGGGWDLDEFLLTGRHEVDAVLSRLAQLDIAVHPGRALDFGCGVGRLTQALAERFESCDGIDIARSMIEGARELNRHGDRCRFHVNETTDLRRFEDATFDFVLSLIVLQHMGPDYIRGYLREFMRVLRPGGVAFFNVPVAYLSGIELPGEAKRASLTLTEPPPSLEPRLSCPLRVRVANRSPVDWPQSARVLVGNHWRRGDGTMVILDDGRGVLDRALGSGEEHEVTLDVTAPASPGDYQLEVDLLQEHFGWFGDAGSPTLRVPLTVGDGDARPESLESRVPGTIEPIMEMYTMSETEVVAELECAGGVVFDVSIEDRCGPTIASLDYVVAKSLSRHPRAGSAGAAQPEGEEPSMLAGRIGDELEAGRAELLAEQLAEIARLHAAPPSASTTLQGAMQLLTSRGDLVGFGLTSERGAAGRASVFIRRGLRRLMFQVLHRQSEFNRTALGVLEELTRELTLSRSLAEVQRSTMGRAEARIEGLERTQSEARVTRAELERGVARAELRYAMLRRRLPSGGVDIDYPGLTDRFRGSRDEIKGRQARYLDHFADRFDVLDIGCGRGEFLELLRDHGVRAVGVDIVESMVAQCEDLGFEAVLQDGLSYLEGRPEQSHDGIFAAQVIEHLGTDDLVRLVRLAFSRLRPGGALVLESVNPACLLALSTFYADFTHHRPVHPEALQWLAQSVGFMAEIEPVTPVPADRKLSPLTASGIPPAEVEDFNRGIAFANQLLFGFQEYALIAHKPL